MKRVAALRILQGLASLSIGLASLCTGIASAHDLDPSQTVAATIAGTTRKCLSNEAMARLTLYQELAGAHGITTIHAEMVDARKGNPMEPIEVSKSTLNASYEHWLNRPKGSLICRPMPEPPPGG